MKKVFLIIIIKSLLSLSVFNCEYEDPEIGRIEDYDFENDIEVNSINEAVKYTFESTLYISDRKEYWQTPEETYNRRNENSLMLGDCEDFTIFFMYLLDAKLQTETNFVAANIKETNYNTALTYLPKFNIYIKPQSNTILSLEQFTEHYSIIEIYSYPETIWMTVHYHKGIER